MRRHLHLGHHAQQDRLDAALRPGDGIEPFEFGPVVDDDQRDARTHREREFLVGLVVAVEHDAGGGRSRPQARLHLAAGRGQEVEAFVQHDPQHGVGGEGLHGIEHARESPGDRAGAVADLLLVHHEQRRAEPVGQLREGEATHLEPPRPAQGGGGPRAAPAVPRLPMDAATAQPSPVRSIDSGAETPRMPRRFAMTCFVPAASHNRAWVSAGSSTSTTVHSV